MVEWNEIQILCKCKCLISAEILQPSACIFSFCRPGNETLQLSIFVGLWGTAWPNSTDCTLKFNHLWSILIWHEVQLALQFKNCSLTLSSTTSLMGGSPSGFCTQAGMNWKPNRKSLSYWRFPLDSARSGPPRTIREGRKQEKQQL